MKRPIRPDEQKLWAMVAATVHAKPGRKGELNLAAPAPAAKPKLPGGRVVDPGGWWCSALAHTSSFLIITTVSPRRASACSRDHLLSRSWSGQAADGQAASNWARVAILRLPIVVR